MNTKSIIRQIAKQHGVTPAEVEKEMRIAMREAQKSTDPIAQAHWKEIAPDGKEPTIEQFLSYIVNQIKS